MEHIVQFAIGIDDEAIKNEIIAGSKRSIENDIKKGVISAIFEARYCGKKPYREDKRTGDVTVSDDADLRIYAEELLMGTLVDCREDIVNRAAEILAESLKRTKAVKEMVNGLKGE